MRRLLPILLLLLLSACDVMDIVAPENEAIRGDGLVVEGWIDEDGYPVVSVTTTLRRPDEPQPVSSLAGLVVRDAEVYVSDGTQRVQLTGALSLESFPPYVYSTRLMKGEVGKTYTLTVSYKGKEATAETTIPEKTELTSLDVFRTEDDVYRIYAVFDPDPEACYGFFSKGSGDTFGYLPVFLGLVDGSVVSGPQTVSVTRGSALTSLKEYKPGFEPGDRVDIRFCTMNRDIYRFWETFQQLTGISYIMTYPTNFSNLPSNMTGAYGYWAGYGTATYSVNIPEEEEEP